MGQGQNEDMNRKLLFGIAVIGVIAADLVVRTVLTGSPASPIGLWDGVFVVVGVTLIQLWYKQGQAASPKPSSRPSLVAQNRGQSPVHCPPLIGGHGAVLVQDRTHRRHCNAVP